MTEVLYKRNIFGSTYSLVSSGDSTHYENAIQHKPVIRLSNRQSALRVETSHWRKLGTQTGITVTGINYGSKERAKLFNFITDNFEFNSQDLNKIIQFTYKNKISVQIINAYLSNAKKYMKLDKSIIELDKNDHRHEELFITYVLNSSPTESVDSFDNYIDNFVSIRDHQTDKINISIR